MESAASRFEQEDETLDEILKQTRGDNNIYSYPVSNMFQKAEANGYTPYCEIKYDSVIEHYSTPDQSSNNPESVSQGQFVLSHCSEDLKPKVSEVSFSSAVAILGSLSKPLRTPPKDVSAFYLFMNIVILLVITSPCTG